MRYIDTGWREEAETLAALIDNELTGECQGLWIQTGYFSARTLGAVRQALEAMRESERPIALVVGSNRRSLAARDLRAALGIVSGPGCSLTVVSFSGALFHPKTYVIRRADGSMCGYVGSANMTPNGMDLNVEAGLIIDTATGDPVDLLARAVESIERWANLTPDDGAFQVTVPTDVDALLERGIVCDEPTPDTNRDAEFDEGEESGPSDGEPGSGVRLGRLGSRRRGEGQARAQAAVTYPEAVESGSIDPALFSTFWVEAGSMSSSASHSQLELPRYGHRFFGHSFNDFSSYEDRVLIGNVDVVLGGREPMTRPLTWHGNNMMERMNLPTPSMGGPEYAGKIVVFERLDDDAFSVSVLDIGSDEAADLRARSIAAGVEYRIGRSERRCGLT